MKLTAQIKLNPSPAQADALRRTLEAANAACAAMSHTAWETKTFRQFVLHKLAYDDTRERFGLSAQVAVRSIAKVADAYKLDKCTPRSFAPLGAGLRRLRSSRSTLPPLRCLSGHATGDR